MGPQSAQGVRARVEALARPLPLPARLPDLHADLCRDGQAFASPEAAWAYLERVCLLLRMAADVIAEAAQDQAETDAAALEDRRTYRWAAGVRDPATWRQLARLGLVARPGATGAGLVRSVEQALNMPRPCSRAAGRRNADALPDLLVRLLVQWYPRGGHPERRWRFAIDSVLQLWGRHVAAEHYRKDMNKRARRPTAPSLEFEYFVASWATRMDRVLASAGYPPQD